MNRNNRIKSVTSMLGTSRRRGSAVHAVAFIALAFTFDGTGANAERYRPDSDPVLETRASALTYLYRDKGGRAYALQLPGAGDDRLGRRYLSLDDLGTLRGLGVQIGYLPDHPDDSVGPCTDADFPVDFNIVYVDGVVYGNIGSCKTNSRPQGSNTQVVDFVLFTSNYQGQAAHAPVIPWFKNALHGHGIYFGDTSLHPCLNGQDGKHNVRMEGWSQWLGHQAIGGSLLHPYWTSTGPFLKDTCGAEMEDGWNIDSGAVTTKYNITLHASQSQWLQYRVDRWNGTSWIVHTAPVVKDMTYSFWLNGPGVFDPSANGLFIGSTGRLGSPRGGSWTIGVRSLRVDWIDAAGAASATPIVEFYHPGLDHYFMTGDTREIRDLDQGHHRGWSRTGHAFLAHASGSAVGSNKPVCRFYGLPSAGLDSHFYSAHQLECDDVAARFAHAWQIEGTNVFEVPLPRVDTARCPPDTVPVYRLWNQRSDSNHRYTINLAARGQMLRNGFLAEGIEPGGVVMCAIAPSFVGQ